jgi:hypothetical protein
MKRKPSFTFGMTKEEHDSLAALSNRPLTQGPIQLRDISQNQTILNKKSFMDSLFDEYTKRSNDDNR